MNFNACNGCTSCSLRCADDVPATLSEWIAIQTHISSLTGTEKATLSSIIAQNKQMDLGDDVYVGMCRFFDMNSHSCSIYNVRPLMCRLMGYLEWMPCPIGKVVDTLDTTSARALLREYSSVERRTLAEWADSCDLPSDGGCQERAVYL